MGFVGDAGRSTGGGGGGASGLSDADGFVAGMGIGGGLRIDLSFSLGGGVFLDGSGPKGTGGLSSLSEGGAFAAQGGCANDKGFECRFSDGLLGPASE